MSVAGPGTFRFGDFELDPAAYELRRAGARVRLPRQPLQERLCFDKFRSARAHQSPA